MLSLSRDRLRMPGFFVSKFEISKAKIILT